MEIRYKDQKEQTIHFDNNMIVLGANQSGKTSLLKTLKEGFTGNHRDFYINNMKCIKDEYNVIYLDDSTEFSNEFKFMKTNYFRKLIYTQIIDDEEEKQILKQANIAFNIIDEKVNKILDDELNTDTFDKITFDIDIENINTIIDKFTNIYINEYLLQENSLPKSTRRKLIYNLLFFRLNNETEKNNIILIDNFDLYLDRTEIIRILYKIDHYQQTHPNNHFILTTSSNIFDLLYHTFVPYHINHDYITKVKDINFIIREVIQTLNANMDHDISPDSQFIDTSILTSKDIDDFKEYFYLPNLYNIGILYTSNEIQIRHSFQEKIISNTIVAKHREEELLYKKMAKSLGIIIL